MVTRYSKKIRRRFLLSALALLVSCAPVSLAPTDAPIASTPFPVKNGKHLQPLVSPIRAASNFLNEISSDVLGVTLRNPKHEVQFSSSGVLFKPSAGPEWSWSLGSVAREDGSPVPAVSLAPVLPRAKNAETIDYRRGILSEQYLAHVNTIEQQFVLHEKPALDGQALHISGIVSSAGEFEKTPQGWVWRDEQGIVTLGRVYVYDNDKREIPAQMVVSESHTEIIIAATDLAHASYPVVIDPEIGSDDYRISDMGGLGNLNFSATEPAIAYNSQNNEQLVVWTGVDVTIGESEIYGQRIDAATGLEVGTNDFRISDAGVDGNAAIDALGVAVAYNSTDNEYLVVWVADDTVDEEREIYGQRLNAETGVEVGTNDFRISDMGPDLNTSYAATLPAVAYNSTDNQYLVVWHGDDDTAPLVDNETEVFGQRLAADGTEIGSNDFRISFQGVDGNTSWAALAPKIAYNEIENEYLVVWHGDVLLVDNELEIFGRQINASTGALIGVASVRYSDIGPGGNANYDAIKAAVAFNNTDNEYMIVWAGDDTTDDENEIHAQRVSGATGAEVGVNDFILSDMGIGTFTQWNAYTPAIAYDSRLNQYLVSWVGDDNFGGIINDEYEIWVQRVDALGNEIYTNDIRATHMGGDTNIINGPPSGPLNFHPLALAYSSQSTEFLAVWTSDDNSVGLVDDEFEIYAQRLSAATANIALTVVDSVDPVVSRNTLSYTLGVSNAGPENAFDLLVTDTLAAGTTFVSASGAGWTCNEASAVVSCTRSSLAIAAAPDITVTVTVDDSTDGLITNVVTLSSGSSDTVLANNTVNEATTTQIDSDGDGTPDLTDLDDDDDGLSDIDESIAGSDRLDPDTDDDGRTDGQ